MRDFEKSETHVSGGIVGRGFFFSYTKLVFKIPHFHSMGVVGKKLSSHSKRS